MNTILFITLLAIVAIQSSSAIKCYSCGSFSTSERTIGDIVRRLGSTIEDDACFGSRKLWKTVECAPGVTTCGRLEFSGNVMRACGSKIPDCALFAKTKVKCTRCSKNLCNSSSAMQISLAAFAAIITSFLIKNIF